MVTYKKLEKGTFNGVNVIEYSMKNEALEVRFLNIGGVLTKIAMAEDQYEQNLVSGKIAKIPSQEKMFRSIERAQQFKEALYLLLVQKREETQISLAVSAPKARIIDKAFKDKQVAPKVRIVILGGLFMGLLIPFALMYLFELFDNKIKSKHDIEKISNTIPIIGSVS